ncbi:MAG: CvpA family protein [Epibacterium sp.]|jgi:membrane protein required for colicin V production|nr:CvpA family protein [Epibacterium sp.]NQX73561.1 CvpA family protein [Epibacterium sp.]
MEGFTIIDGAVALVIVISALLAYSRGLVREIMSILGWVAAAIGAFLFAAQVEPLMAEVPVLGEYIAESCELSMIVAFFAVFAVALIVVSFFTPLLSGLVQRSALGGLDQGGGFLFGVLRGILLIAIAFFVYNVVMTGQSFVVVDDSRSAVVFNRMINHVEDQNPEQALGWLTGKYEELIGGCTR